MDRWQEYIIMGFGALVALVGLYLVLQSKKIEVDRSRIKIFGFEIEMSTSALFIFVIGCVLFALPYIMKHVMPEKQKQAGTKLPKTPVLFELGQANANRKKGQVYTFDRQVDAVNNVVLTLIFSLFTFQGAAPYLRDRISETSNYIGY